MNGRSVVVLAALAGSVLLGACTSSGSGGSPTTAATGAQSSAPTSSAPASSPAASGNGSLAAAQLAAAVLQAASSASSVHVSGQFATEAQSAKIDMTLAKSGSKGSIAENGTTLQIVSAGGVVYLKAPAAFFAQFVPAAQRGQVMALVRGKWLKIPPKNKQFGGLNAFSSISSFVRQLSKNSAALSKLTTGPSKTVNGTPAVSFVDPKNHTTVYVAATGTPYVLQVVDGGAQPGMLNFTSWNAPVTITAPPASQVLDLSQLTGG